MRINIISRLLGRSLMTLTLDFYTVVRRKAAGEGFKHRGGKADQTRIYSYSLVLMQTS